MVVGEFLILENHQCKYREDRQRDGLLNHFELPQVEGTSVGLETDAVRRHLKTIFHQSDAQLIRIIRGIANFPVPNFRCPYQAMVIKIFAMIKSPIVRNDFHIAYKSPSLRMS